MLLKADSPHSYYDSSCFLEGFDLIAPSLSDVRPSTFVPTSCCHSSIESEQSGRSRSQRPLSPPLDAEIFTPIRSTFPGMPDMSAETIQPSDPSRLRRGRTPSPTSSYTNTIDISTMPSSVARDSRRKSSWLKARAQYARDRELHRYAECDLTEPRPETARCPQRAGSSDYGPRRKQTAFVKEEERKCFFEDRVGTPHMSELETDFEIVPLSVEEMGMSGEVEASTKDQDKSAYESMVVFKLQLSGH